MSLDHLHLRPSFRLGDRLVDLERRRVTSLHEDVALTAAEAALLEALHAAGGAPVERSALTTGILGFSPRARTRTLDTLLWRLRAKTEADPAAPRHVISLRNKGLALIGAIAVEHGPAPELFGREIERARLLEWVAQPGLVQVLGTGGVGKSALLRALAADARVLFAGAGGVHVFDLGQVGGASSLAAACVATLGMDPQTAANPGAAIATIGDALLLVDGVEMMASAAVEVFIGALVAQAPALRVVLFSRVMISLTTNRTMELQRLSEEAARALLTARVGVGAVADGALLEALGVVEGNPLAIELVAGQLRSGHRVSAAELSAGLEAVVHRSWDYLPESGRRDLVALAAVAAAVDLIGAASIWGRDFEAAVDGLEGLRRHSVLHADADGTFRVLDSVRAMVRQKAPRMLADARVRHAAVQADLVARPLNASLWAAMRRVAADLRQALEVLEDATLGVEDRDGRHARLAVALVPLVTHAGLLAGETLVGHLRRALERVGGKGGGELCEALVLAEAELALHDGDVARAENVLQQSFEFRWSEALALEARIANMRGSEEGLVARLRAALGRDEVDAAGRARLLARLGALHGRFGRMAEAAAAFEACLALPAEARWPGLEVEVLQQLATAQIIMRPGAPGPEKLYAEARRLAEMAGLARYLPVIVANRTALYFLMGDNEAASASAHEALELARRSGRPVTVAQALVALGGIAMRRDDLGAARAAFDDARGMAGDDTQQQEQIAHLDTVLALLGGDIDGAAVAVERVGTLASRPPLDCLVALHRAMIAWHLGDRDDARDGLAEARRRGRPLQRADIELACDLAETLFEAEPDGGQVKAVPPALMRRYQRLIAKPGQVGLAGEQLRMLLARFGVGK